MLTPRRCQRLRSCGTRPRLCQRRRHRCRPHRRHKCRRLCRRLLLALRRPTQCFRPACQRRPQLWRLLRRHPHQYQHRYQRTPQRLLSAGWASTDQRQWPLAHAQRARRASTTTSLLTPPRTARCAPRAASLAQSARATACSALRASTHMWRHGAVHARCASPGARSQVPARTSATSATSGGTPRPHALKPKGRNSARAVQLEGAVVERGSPNAP